MNRIDQLFAQKQQGILSVYFCAGHPTAELTVPTLTALQERGVDMVEIGIPFSDPMADGPVIQAAATQALRQGMTLRRLFSQLEQIRPPKGNITMPLLLMGYLNPIMHYGFENFCRSCVQAGIDGAIIPDLPFADYLRDLKPLADRYGLRIVMLITPETSPERIRFIDQNTNGFIYMVSSAATTGAQQQFGADRQEYFARIDSMNLRNPRLVGFGISNAQTLQAAQAHAAGAIVGSKFVSLLEQTQSPEQATDLLLQQLGLSENQ